MTTPLSRGSRCAWQILAVRGIAITTNNMQSSAGNLSMRIRVVNDVIKKLIHTLIL